MDLYIPNRRNFVVIGDKYYVFDEKYMDLKIPTIQYYYQSIRALIKFILENIPNNIPLIELNKINDKINEFKLNHQ